MKTLRAKNTTHICLVSDESTPNISPVLDTKIRPQKVVLVVSPQMKQHARWLEAVLKKSAKIDVSFFPIDDAWNLAHIRERLGELLKSLENEQVILNASCGTKAMCLAAFEVFRNAHCPIFFVHREKDLLIWLYPGNRGSHSLADKVKLTHFLAAQGTSIESRGNYEVKKGWQDLGKTLIDEIERFSRHIGTLNWLAQRAEGRLKSSGLSGKFVDDPAFQDLLDLFVNAQIFNIKNNCLVFPNEAARFFTNGGWLEQFVFAEIKALREKYSEIQDLSQSLEVNRYGHPKSVKNELDVALLCNNRLYIIECKTKRFKSVKHADGPGAEAIYKIDTLQDIFGGLHAHGMLVSYLRVSDYDKSRANDLGIQVCDYKMLRNLHNEIRQWMNL